MSNTDSLAEDTLSTLQSIVAMRDSARRANNPLLKPLSEIDMSTFTNHHQISPSYYRLPETYPMPICSGRYKVPFCKPLLNDRYCSITSGSEYRFKQKNVHEDALFKNEDEMYGIDHVIQQLTTVVASLEKELANAEEWDKIDDPEKGLYKTRHLSRVTLAFIDKFYAEFTAINTTKRVTEKIKEKNPILVLKTFIQRLTAQLEAASDEKKLRLDDWRICC